jgi:hypothetical protein
MSRGLRYWILLLSFVGGMLVSVLLIWWLHRHFGHPIAFLLAMPPGTPAWWYFTFTGLVGTLVICWYLAARCAAAILREWSSLKATVEEWWAKKPNNRMRTGVTGSERAVPRAVCVFIGLPAGFWALATWIVSGCLLGHGASCWLAIAWSVSTGSVVLAIIRTALAGRLARGHAPGSPMAEALFTYGAAVLVLLLAPAVFTMLVLILLIVAPLGVWLEKGIRRDDGGSEPGPRIRLS